LITFQKALRVIKTKTEQCDLCRRPAFLILREGARQAETESDYCPPAGGHRPDGGEVVLVGARGQTRGPRRREGHGYHSLSHTLSHTHTHIHTYTHTLTPTHSQNHTLTSALVAKLEALEGENDTVNPQRRGNNLNNRFTEMCCGTEAGSYLRLTDSCITQLKAQGPSRNRNESKEEEVVEEKSSSSALAAKLEALEGEKDTVLNLRTTTSKRCAAVPRRARISGS